MELPDVSPLKTALCSPEQLQVLLKWDHHVVDVDGELGILLTYHLMDRSPPHELVVVFAHVDKHPKAPDAVQAVITELRFA